MRIAARRSIAAGVFGAGVILSRLHEPGIVVESRSLGDTPALHFAPSGAGPHPKALLAHGFSASKETMYRFGEALAAAGIDAWVIDLPGHGSSPLRYPGDNVATIALAAQAIGPIDLYVGHSMGAYAGGAATRAELIAPRLFVSVGALAELGDHPPTHLMLAGRFEEAVEPRLLENASRRTGAELVRSRWSDHALEPYDPSLIDAAVEKSCATLGLDRPKPIRRWIFRLLGALFAPIGALGLAITFERSRAFAVAPAVVIGVALSAGSWLSVQPNVSHLPLQAIAIAGIGSVAFGLAKVGLPRWTLVVAVAFLSFASALSLHSFAALLAALTTIVLGSAAAIARFGEPRAEPVSRGWKGDLAFGVFAGYALGQWMPAFI